jgi:neurofibromin 1
MMETREPLEWHFKQLDHAVGLSFKSNFHFALVGHLLKVCEEIMSCNCKITLS